MNKAQMRWKLIPEDLNGKDFSGYGKVLDSIQSGYVSLFKQSHAAGWQAAINRVTSSTARSLHCHPDSYECFAPTAGMAVIVVALPDHPEKLKAFRLTHPVVLSPHVWHTLLTSTKESRVFICENAEVQGREHLLDFIFEL